MRFNINIDLDLQFILITLEFNQKIMAKGFATGKESLIKVNQIKKKELGSERMISWSPWPPANFQTKYPAFPLVMTIIILSIVQIYLSILN